MDIRTIQQLDEWMTAHCYNDSYAIGARNIHEGYGLELSGGLYVWYYTERGVRSPLAYFETEAEAVAHAFKAISADSTANRHLIGLIKEKAREDALLAELERRNIKFFKDVIPYGGLNDPRTRVFVFGCDINAVLDLREEYFERR
jgi:hypothetical protein